MNHEEVGVLTATGQELVPLLEALDSRVPKGYEGTFDDMLQDVWAYQPVRMVAAAASCCSILEGRFPDACERTRFGEASWRLLDVMLNQVAGARRKVMRVPRSPGEVVVVPSKTSFLTGILLARTVNLRAILESGPTGAVYRYDLSEAARGTNSFESGPSEEDRDRLFEALAWKKIFPSLSAGGALCSPIECDISRCNLVCRKKDLRARLERDALFGCPWIVLLNPGDGPRWRNLARSIPWTTVAFCEPDVQAAVGRDEDILDCLLGDLLKLTSGSMT